MTDPLDSLIARWTRLGAAFAAAPAEQTPDLERLILDTARHAPQMARLYIMAATWLHSNGELVARHRLTRLTAQELDAEQQAVLGLLFDSAQQGLPRPLFRSITRHLAPASTPRPLFDVENSSPALAARAARRASPLSRRWNLWCEPIGFKPDALRPAQWVIQHNPELAARADFRGDLRASILAALAHDENAGSSELSLARSAGGSRAQTHKSLDNLELTSRIRRTRQDGTGSIRISLQSPA